MESLSDRVATAAALIDIDLVDVLRITGEIRKQNPGASDEAIDTDVIATMRLVQRQRALLAARSSIRLVGDDD